MRKMTRLGLLAGLGLLLAGCVDDGYRGGGGYYRGYQPGYAAPVYRGPVYYGPAYRGPAYRGPSYRAPAYSGPPPRRDWDRRDDHRGRNPGPPPPQRQGPPPQQRREGDAIRSLLDRNR